VRDVITIREAEMAKNWRLAVCTRWKPLVSLLLVCLGLLGTGVVVFFVGTTVDEYPERRLERRIQRVKVGMSVAELESILGPPDSKTDGVNRKSPNFGEGGSNRIVEYGYSAESRFGESQTQYKGIFVDESTGKVALIHLSRDGWSMLDSTFWGEWAGLIALGLIILVVLIVMLLFRGWCRTVTESGDSQER
jgi:hypothetical protein